MPSTLDQRDLRKRHPLCPHCDYDLIATLAANKRICPECGEGFDLGDLKYEWRQGDWSNAVAARRGLLTLGLRFILAAALATAFSALAIELMNLRLPRILTFLVALAQACAVGAACSRKLVDQAGFESILLTLGACLMALAASALGYLAAVQFVIAPTFTGIAFMHVLVAVAGAWVWIIHSLLLDQ